MHQSLLLSAKGHNLAPPEDAAPAPEAVPLEDAAMPAAPAPEAAPIEDAAMPAAPAPEAAPIEDAAMPAAPARAAAPIEDAAVPATPPPPPPPDSPPSSADQPPPPPDTPPDRTTMSGAQATEQVSNSLNASEPAFKRAKTEQVGAPTTEAAKQPAAFAKCKLEKPQQTDTTACKREQPAVKKAKTDTTEQSQTTTQHAKPERTNTTACKREQPAAERAAAVIKQEPAAVPCQQLLSGLARYATTVQKNGFYIGLLDLALLCKAYGKQGIVIFREKDLQLRVQPLEKLIQESLNVSGFRLPESWTLPSDAEKWHFLSVRCDYQPAHHGECNHWMPVLTREELGEEFDVQRHSQLSTIHDALYEYTQKVQAATMAEDPHDEDDGFADAQLDSALDQIALLERQLSLFKALLDADFCAEEVPADGNCGLWSVMSLRDGGCCGNAEEAAQQVKEERLVLARAWSDVSVNILWQQLWKHFGMEAELGAEDFAAASSHAKTPPRRQDGERVWLDEISPVKQLDPKKISECKPAKLGNAKGSSSLVLRQPGPNPEDTKRGRQKKTAEPQAAEGDQGEEEAAEEDWAGMGMLKGKEKTIWCDAGGFKSLQQKLLKSAEVKCNICLELLKIKDFNQVKFDACVAGERLPLPAPHLTTESKDAAAGEQEPVAHGDWRDYVQTFAPVIELLPPGCFGKSYPFRCLVCTSKRWPKGKVADLCHPRLKTVKHFLFQHLNSNTHIQNLRNSENVVSVPEKPAENAEIECKGIFLDDAAAGRNLAKYRPEMELWLSMANFEEHPSSKHLYNLIANKWHIRSAKCSKKMDEKALNQNLPVCEECYSLGAADSIVRRAQRLALKHYAAELLSARLFSGEQGAQETLQRISETPLYKSSKFKIEDVLAHPTPKLQAWVRAAWASDSKPSAAMQRFMDTVVTPSLGVSMASVPERLAEVAATFDALLKGQDCTDEQMINMQVAAAAIKGQFERHPLLLGLTLQTSRMLEKQERGVTTMAGRRSAESDTAASLIKDSGLQLAVATGNNTLVRQFGLSGASGRFKYSELERVSLPSPAVALNFPSVLENNFVLADQRYPRKQGAPKSSLASPSGQRLYEIGLIGIFTHDI
eukprot:s1066_g9.t1